jgi:hypothetical protein
MGKSNYSIPSLFIKIYDYNVYSCYRSQYDCFSTITSNSTESTRHPTAIETSDPKSKIASLLHNSGAGTDIRASSDNSIINQGMKEKNSILLANQDNVRAGNPNSIITKRKGKIADNTSLNHACMRPSLNKWY